MKTGSEKKQKEKLILSALLLSVVICSSIIILNLTKIKTKVETESIPLSEKDYCVLVTGVAENSNILKQVFEGATIVSNFYDSAIQYKVPENKVLDSSLKSLFDYAGFVDADCVVTYMDFENINSKCPVDISGNPIPVVTIGNKPNGFTPITHIGIDYVELGKSMAFQTAEYLKDQGVVFILNTFSESDVYGQLFYDTLNTELKKKKNIKIISSTKNNLDDYSIEDSIRQQVASSGNLDLILSLSEQGTVLAAQTLSDLNLTSRTKIIGYGDDSDSLAYYEKGIVMQLFCVDVVDIGKKAVKQFFEYKTTGATDNYVSAKMKLLK